MRVQIPESIRSLIPYVPGKPIEETQRELRLKKVVKLASNENPLGCGRLARKAILLAQKEIHRYPDASAFHLKTAIRRLHGLEKNDRFGVTVGNGSNELIELLIRTLCVPGDSIVTSKSAFIAYKISAQAHGGSTLEAAIGSDLIFDLEEMLRLVRSNERVQLVFLPNPNNPTGTYVSKEPLTKFIAEIARVREGAVRVVLDDAYAEYVTAKDAPKADALLHAFPETVVMLRTFSKVHGLAGLRVGYAIGSSELLGFVERVRMPFNVGSIALAAATASLRDAAHIKRSLALNREAMKFWCDALKDLKIPYWKSQANFVLANVQRGWGMTGPEVFQECLRKGVIFRPIANYGYPEALRITLGTAMENRFALKALQAVRASHG